MLFIKNGVMTTGMEKRLRIIQVVNVRWFNATAWYGLNIARLLKNAGHDVRVIGLPGADSFNTARDMGLAPIGMNLNTSNPVRLPFLMRKMRTLIQEFRPHVVNCHRGEGTVLWGLFKAAGYPFALVRTRGDQRPPKGNTANRRLHTRLIDALVATNSRTLGQCREALGIPENLLALVPGGVDTDAFKQDQPARERIRAELGFSASDCVIGLLGRIDPVKGQKELIEALGCVKKNLGPERGGALRLLLVGFGATHSTEDALAWAEAAGLGGQTVITGKVADVAAHINAMDLGVVASQGSEAIARAAFEIMACKVPLVGTNVGVMPDLLAKHALVPPGDAAALAALLERACTDGAFLAALRQEQEKRMRSCSHAAFLTQTLAVYAQAIDHARGGRAGRFPSREKVVANLHDRL